MFETSYYKMLKRLIREFAPRFSKLIGITGMPKTSADFFINTIRETMEFRESKNFVRHDLVDILRDIKKNQQEIDFGKKIFVNKLFLYLQYELNLFNNLFEEITENLLAAQAMVFFAAGFETSSTTISFALYELAIAPEVQEKLRTEILETLKRHNGQLSYDIVNEMKYLHMVIQGLY